MKTLFRWMVVLALVALFAHLAFGQTTVQVPYSGTSGYSGTVTITIPAGCTVTTGAGPVVTCPPPPVIVPPVIPPGPARSKFVPTGGDDQKALYGLAAKGPVEVSCPGNFTPPFPCTLKISSSTLPNGADIYFDDFVIVQDLPGYATWANLFSLDGVNHITLAGSGGPNAAVFTMPNAYATGSVSRNCVWINQSSTIFIGGINMKQCGEDAVYVGNSSTDVHVTKFKFSDTLRNGFSITDKVTNVLFDYGEVFGMHNVKGGIADGADVEPNGISEGNSLPGQFVKGVVLDHIKFHDNAEAGLCVCLYFQSSAVPIDVTVTNSDFSNNGKYPFQTGPAGAWPVPLGGPGVRGSGNTVNGKPVSFPFATSVKKPAPSRLPASRRHRASRV